MTVPDLTLRGRLLFVLGLVGLAALNLVHADLAPGLQPPLPFVGGGPVVAYVSGALLLFAALSLLGHDKLVRQGGLAVAFFWVAWILLGHLAQLTDTPADVVAWVSLSEAASLAAAAWLMSASASGGTGDRTRWAVRLIVGVMLVGFGVVHLTHREAIAGMIPEWMPARDLWPWVTGAANLAAGLAFLSGVMGSLAAVLVGAMFFSWIFLAHIPRLIADVGSRAEWTGLMLNLALIGVVWTAQRVFVRPAH